jgi:hypothetical protein
MKPSPAILEEHHIRRLYENVFEHRFSQNCKSIKPD